jgi:hypothetical protein
VSSAGTSAKSPCKYSCLRSACASSSQVSVAEVLPSKLIANTATAAFVVLCLIAAYLGLTPNVIPEYGQSDKGLHFVTFFLLTVGSFSSSSSSYHMLPHFLSLPPQQLASDHMQLPYSINLYKHHPLPTK